MNSNAIFASVFTSMSFALHYHYYSQEGGNGAVYIIFFPVTFMIGLLLYEYIAAIFRGGRS